MKSSVLMAALAVAVAGQAHAQSAETPAATAATPSQGVMAYAPEFFAASQPNTAMDMINRLPGFTFDGGDDVRGFAGAAGNVLIDGRRPTSKNDALSDILSRIPANNVERIELIRGGAPGVDMQGRNVIANVIRKKGDSFQQAVQGGGHIFFGTGKFLPNFRYEISKRSGDTLWEGAISRGVGMDDSVGSGSRVLTDASGAVIERQSAFTEGDGGPYGAKGSFKTPLWGGEFRANTALSTNDFKSEAHFSTPSDKTDVVDKNTGKNFELGVNYDRPLGERFRLETLALQKLGTSDYLASAVSGPDRTDFSEAAKSGESIVRAELQYSPSDTLTFQGGGEAAFNFRESDVAYVENGTAADIPWVRAEERRAEAFGQASWRPTKKLSFEAGSRFESSTISSTSRSGAGEIEQERSFFYAKPRATMTWSPVEQTQVRLRVEREVGQLDFGDFAASADLTQGNQAAGNVSLVPDKTWTYEAAFEQRFWGDGALVLTLRHQQITDVIDRMPVDILGPDGPDADTLPDVIGVADAPGNIGDGVNNELEVNFTLPLDRLHVKGGELKVEYSMSDSEVTDPTTGEKRRISGQRPQSTEVNFRQDLPQYKMSWGVGYYGGWEETHYLFNQVQHYEIWNFYHGFVEYKPDGKTSLLVEVSNLDPFEFRRTQTMYTGPRDTGTVSAVDTFTTQSQLRAFVRLRRTF